MPVISSNATTDDLVRRRDELLAQLGMSLADIEARRDEGRLTAEEWSAWEELDGILYLLGGDGRH